jgi:hypothetical protein
MKKSVNAKTKRGAKRDLFAELREGMKALIEETLGRRKLRTHVRNRPDEPALETREKRNGKP